MKKSIALILAAVMCMGLLSACGSSTAETTKAAETTAASTQASYKLGGQGPLTGGAAIYGLAAMRGAEIAVEEINAAEGYTFFDLKYEDDQHDVSVAPNAYNSLKDWGMQIYLGCVTSGPSLVTSELSYADSIFFLTPSASTDGVPTGKDNVYQMCFADSNQGSASAQYIFDKQLGTKIAVIYESDIDYSVGIYDTFMEQAKKLGLEIVSESSFTKDAVDFSVQVAAAQNAGADLVFLPIYYQQASQILSTADQNAYEPVFFGVDGMDGILTLEGFDTTLAEDVILLTPFSADATDEKTVNFVKAYQEKHNEIPNQFAADNYDCVYAIYAALKAGNAAPSMTAAELNTILCAQFNSMSFDGITGTAMTWSNGYVTKAPKGMIIKEGAYVGLD